MGYKMIVIVFLSLIIFCDSEMSGISIEKTAVLCVDETVSPSAPYFTNENLLEIKTENFGTEKPYPIRNCSLQINYVPGQIDYVQYIVIDYISLSVNDSIIIQYGDHDLPVVNSTLLELNSKNITIRFTTSSKSGSAGFRGYLYNDVKDIKSTVNVSNDTSIPLKGKNNKINLNEDGDLYLYSAEIPNINIKNSNGTCLLCGEQVTFPFMLTNPNISTKGETIDVLQENDNDKFNMIFRKRDKAKNDLGLKIIKITEEETVIQYPNDGNLYPNNVEFMQFLVFDEIQDINFNFQIFETEKNYDFLEILNINQQVLKRLSGQIIDIDEERYPGISENDVNFTLPDNANVVILRFVSNGAIGGNGYKFTAKTVSINSTIPTTAPTMTTKYSSTSTKSTTTTPIQNSSNSPISSTTTTSTHITPNSSKSSVSSTTTTSAHITPDSSKSSVSSTTTTSAHITPDLSNSPGSSTTTTSAHITPDSSKSPVSSTTTTSAHITPNSSKSPVSSTTTTSAHITPGSPSLPTSPIDNSRSPISETPTFTTDANNTGNPIVTNTTTPPSTLPPPTRPPYPGTVCNVTIVSNNVTSIDSFDYPITENDTVSIVWHFNNTNTDLWIMFLLDDDSYFKCKPESEMIVYSGIQDTEAIWEVLEVYNSTTLDDKKVVFTKYPGQSISVKVKTGYTDPSNSCNVSDLHFNYIVVAINATYINITNNDPPSNEEIHVHSKEQPFTHTTLGYPSYIPPNNTEIYQYIPDSDGIQILFLLLDWGTTFDYGFAELSLYTGSEVNNDSIIYSYKSYVDLNNTLISNPVGETLTVRFTSTEPIGAVDTVVGCKWMILILSDDDGPEGNSTTSDSTVIPPSTTTSYSNPILFSSFISIIYILFNF